MPDTASIATTTPAPEWRVAPRLTDYPHAIAEMQARIAAIQAGTAPECVWLVEHPPLYTAGTSARPGELIDPHRFPTYRAGRGGQWTYHGPGQRTAYVMLDLTRPHGSVPPRDLRCYVHGLEEWLIGALASLGGLEIAGLSGVILESVSLRRPVLLDGFISTAAALVAAALAPGCQRFMIAAHRSQELGHAAALAALDLRPLLDLDLRLGEGTGALLALPLVRAAIRVQNDMATFEEAGVSDR